MSSPQDSTTPRRPEATMRKSESPSKAPVLDIWSIKERLCLASAVIRNGDQNWMSVSRAMRPFLEPNRPADWFSQKNCALQYASLLESVEGTKRKKREKPDSLKETPSQTIMRLLTQERIDELKRLMYEEKVIYVKLKEDIIQVKTGQLDEKVASMCQQIENEKLQQEQEAERHQRWLREREERQLSMHGKPGVPTNTPQPRKRKIPRGGGGLRRNSNQSDQSSGAESIVEGLKSESVEEDDSRRVTSTHAPTSPLLTSLLQSPAASSQASSILHSAITSQRAHPLECLLMTSPKVTNVVPPPPSTVSTGLNNLVSNAIGGMSEEHAKPVSSSPSAGAPTLSMLLELPPSLPGKPLPELPSAVRTPAPQTPPPPYSVAASFSLSTASTSITSAVTSTATTTPSVIVTPEQLHHPEHQEMRVRRETETDELVEVVELDNADRTLKQLQVQDMEVIEVCPTDALLDESSEDVPLAEILAKKSDSVGPTSVSADNIVINDSAREETSQELNEISSKERIENNVNLDTVKGGRTDTKHSNNTFNSDNVGQSSSTAGVNISRRLDESVILRAEPLQLRHDDHVVQVVVPPDDTKPSRNIVSVPEIIDISGDDSHLDVFENQMKDISQAEVLEMIVGPVGVRDPSSFRLLSENEIKKEKEEVNAEDYDENAQSGWDFARNENVTQRKEEVIKKENTDSKYDVKDNINLIDKESSLGDVSEHFVDPHVSTIKSDVSDDESEGEAADKKKVTEDERETCDSEKENIAISGTDNSRVELQGKESLNSVTEDSKTVNIDLKEEMKFEVEEPEYLISRSAEEDNQDVSGGVESDKRTFADDDENLSATDSVRKEQRSKVSTRDKSLKRETVIKKDNDHQDSEEESSVEKLEKSKNTGHLEQRQEGLNKKHKESRELKSLEGAILYNKCRGGSRACGKCYSCLKNIDKSLLKEIPIEEETKSDEGSKHQESGTEENKTDRDLRQQRRKMAKELQQYSRYEKGLIEKDEGETSKRKLDNKEQNKIVEQEHLLDKELEKSEEEKSSDKTSLADVKSKPQSKRLRGRPVKLCKGNRRCGKCKKCLTRYKKLYKWKAKMKKGRLEKVIAEDEGSNESQITTRSSVTDIETDSGSELVMTKKSCSKDMPCGDCSSCVTDYISRSERVMREKSVNENDDEVGETSKVKSSNVKQACEENSPCGNCVKCKSVNPVESKTKSERVEGKIKESESDSLIEETLEREITGRKLRKGTIVKAGNKVEHIEREEKDIRKEDKVKKEDSKSKQLSRIDTKSKTGEHTRQDEPSKEGNDKGKSLQKAGRRKTRQSEAKIEESTKQVFDKESQEKIQSKKKDESKDKPDSEVKIEDKEKHDKTEIKEKKKDHKEISENRDSVENKQKRESREKEESRDKTESREKFETKERKDKVESRDNKESKEKKESKVLENKDKKNKEKTENKDKKDDKEIDKIGSKEKKESKDKAEIRGRKESRELENKNTDNRKEQKERLEKEGKESESKNKTKGLGKEESVKSIEKKTDYKQKSKEKQEREKSKPGRKKGDRKETSASRANSDVDEEDDDRALSAFLAREVKQEQPSRPPSSAQSEADFSESIREIRVPFKRRTYSITESVSSSPLPISEEDKEHKAWKKAIMLLHGRLASHKYASLFLRPITEDQAPGYSKTVYKALDLATIKRNIETGAIRTTVEFQRDVMLMFQNAVMYNRSTHIINEMAREMQEEAMQHIQDFINTQKLVQAKGEMTIRRETRMTDTPRHIDLPNVSTPSSSLGYDMELGGPFEQLIPSRSTQDKSEEHERKRKRSPTLSEAESSSVLKRRRV